MKTNFYALKDVSDRNFFTIQGRTNLNLRFLGIKKVTFAFTLIPWGDFLVV